MQNSRKKWLVNSDFQIRFTAFFTICALFNFLIFIGATNWYFARINEEMLKGGISSENPIHQFMFNQHLTLNVILIGVSAIGLLVMFCFGIWFSNKVAGPISRVVEELKSLDRNHPRKIISFREGDFFFELRDALNEFLEHQDKKSKKNEASEDKVA